MPDLLGPIIVTKYIHQTAAAMMLAPIIFYARLLQCE